MADFEDLKKRIGYGYPEQKVSEETIGSSRLSMIDHEQDGRNKIYRIYLKKPFAYGGKQITEVIAAHYGGEGDMIEFFDYVKELVRWNRARQRISLLVTQKYKFPET